MKKEKEAIIQNLKDAGCSKEKIECIVKCMDENKTCEEICMLYKHREELVNKIHKCQAELDCLDYLIFQLQKKK